MAVLKVWTLKRKPKLIEIVRIAALTVLLEVNGANQCFTELRRSAPTPHCVRRHGRVLPERVDQRAESATDS